MGLAIEGIVPRALLVLTISRKEDICIDSQEVVAFPFAFVLGAELGGRDQHLLPELSLYDLRLRLLAVAHDVKTVISRPALLI